MTVSLSTRTHTYLIETNKYHLGIGSHSVSQTRMKLYLVHLDDNTRRSIVENATVVVHTSIYGVHVLKILETSIPLRDDEEHGDVQVVTIERVCRLKDKVTIR